MIQYFMNELMTAFNFTEQDLLSNENKIITVRQKERLVEYTKSRKNALYVSAGISAVIFLIYTLVSAKTFEQVFLSFTLIVCFSVLLGLYLAIEWKRIKKTSFSEIQEIQGRFNKNQTRTRYGISYSIQIGKVKLYLDELQFNAISENHQYTIYYIPFKYTPIILSVQIRD